MDDAAAYSSVLRGKHVAGFGAGEGAQLYVQDGLVEVGGSLEVGGGDFEPGNGVAVEFANGVSPAKVCGTTRE